VIVSADAGVCNATGVDLGTPETWDNCLVASVINDAVEPFELGTTEVTWTVTDGSGNIETCTQNVTVFDTELPVISCPGDIIVPADAGFCFATGVELGSPEISDNCSIASVINDAEEPFAIGTTVVTWTVTDGSGNIATCTQNVTVIDTESPSITCPADVTVGTDAGFCYATGVDLGTPLTSDNCEVASVINDAIEPFTVGTIVVTWTITDGAGNIATCTQNVTVEDTEAPVVTCPIDVTVSTDAGFCYATGVELGFPEIFDNCSILSYENDAVEPFALGTTIVTWTAEDYDGNTGTCTQNVVVVAREIEVYAGIDATISSDNSYFVADASATNYASILWTSDGDGTFDNPTILNPTYSPGTNDIETGFVHLTITISGYCSEIESDQMTITINPAGCLEPPTVFAGADATICEGETYTAFEAVATNYSALQWYTSTGNGYFDDETLLNPTYFPDNMDVLMGSVEICLLVSPSDPGCEMVSDCFNLTINQLPLVNCPADSAVCVDLPAFTLTGATPSGGIYSGSGVVNGMFDAAFAGVGDHLITYNYSEGGCENSCSFTITVNPLPDVYCPDGFAVCEDAQPFELTGAEPVGGVYSGNGVINGVFNPPMAGTGNHTITYTYTDGNQCVNSCEFTITVNPLPIVTCPQNMTVCVDAAEFELSGGNPAGGEYSGAGVNGGFFYPAVAGVGQHVVNYSFEDQNGCVNSCEFVINVINLPTVNCPADFAVCVDLPAFTLTGATPSGGIYSGSGVVNGMFDAAFAGVGDHLITYNYSTINNCTNSCQFTISVAPAPSVSAGSDAIICTGFDYSITDASASESCGLIWTTSGDGNFDNINSVNPTYTPGASDIATGSVVLCLVAQPCIPCNNVANDCMTLTIQALPSASAGGDATIPGNGTYTFNGSSASNFAGLLWSTNGNGTFNNSSVLHPTYTPGSNDLSNGSAELCLTAQPLNPCSIAATDCMNLTIGTGPTVTAGPDISLCGDSQYLIAGAAAENYASLIWASEGDGTFNNSTLLNPVYTFGPNDLLNGTVELCLTANPIAPSTIVVTDCMLLTVEMEPTAWAGNDATVCSGESYILQATVENACEVTWQTSGNGQFDNIHLVNASYTPGSADLAAGSVVLCINALPCNPCTIADSDCVTLHFVPSATANAGVDGTICQNKTFAVSGTSTQSCGTLWSTTGDGTFVNSNLAATTYTPGAADIAAGTVSLCFSAMPCNPCQVPVTDCLTLTIRHLPVSNAGPDAGVCAGSSYTLSGSTQYSCGNQWTKSGDGTFNNVGLLNATYTPGTADIAAGSVTLGLRAFPCNPCSVNTTDYMTLNIYKNPTANAGADVTLCDNQSYTLNGSATRQCSLSWNTSGDGVFNNNTLANAVYTPGPSDKQNGNVVLCLTAIPCSPCNISATDCMTITYTPSPTAFAGDNATICENSQYTLNGSVDDACGNVWTTSGDGTFNNTQLINATYTPGTGDQANGFVELCFTASACSPCTVASTDCMILTIMQRPEAFAGQDATINSGSTFIPAGATASSYNSLLWTTLGDGVFDAPTILHPVYTPGANDISNASVELCLTANAADPCTTSVSDCLMLAIGSVPVVNAGPDQTICESNTYWLEFAEVTKYSSLHWATAGDGTFNNSNTLHPIYYPGANDKITGQTDLCLTAQPIPPSTFPVTDCMTLFIQKNPFVDAGSDGLICAGGSYDLNPIADNSCGILWETQGDGLFDNPTLPTTTYLPGAVDIAAGSVVLCITATACNPCTLPVTDCLTLTIQHSASANAGNDVTICQGNNISLNGVAENACGILWGTSGDGEFDDNSMPSATYFPGQSDLANGSAELCLTAYSCNPCEGFAADCLTVSFSPQPEALVGDDLTICEGLSVLLWPSESNNCGLLWTTSGDGVFENPAEAITIYTPGPADVEAGYADICLTAFACEPCTQPATDCFTVYIQLPPTVFAGNDLTICEGNFVNLTEASGENYSEVIWTTSNGTGYFENENELNTTYIPGTPDLILGCVDLHVAAIPLNPCMTGDSDDITVCFRMNPTVIAGEDVMVCAGSTVLLTGVVENSCGSFWTTSGDGLFDNPQSANAVYTPGQADLAAGFAELCLTAYACDPCNEDASDCLSLYFQQPPTVFAGNDMIVCEGNPVVLSQAAGTNFSAVLWISINGSGTFENESALNTTYYPSMSDMIQGCVTHLIMVSPFDPCLYGTTDEITICFQKAPVAFAGDDATLCGGSSYNVSGTVANNCGFFWYSDGDGIFDNVNSLNVNYQPGTNDVTTGFVTLWLVAGSCDPCTEPATDNIDLYFVQPPTEIQLADVAVCEGEIYCFDVYAENYSSLYWSGGEGFDDPASMTPCYTPTQEDITKGTVELCLTLSPLSPCEVSVSDCMILTILGSQQITIPQGWSGLSSYVTAVNPDMDVVMSAIENEIIVMNDLTGHIFMPSENINTIGNWDNYTGYTIKVTQEVTLNICGSPVENRTLNLAQGWNLIPVLTGSDVPAAEIFNQISGALIIAKEVAGIQLYYPAYQIYTLQNLRSGKAYYLKVSEACSVTFPVTAEKSESIIETGQIFNTTPWNDVQYVPGTHIFVLPAGILSGITPGSFIGAFNSQGFCSGMVQITETDQTWALFVTGIDSYGEGDYGLTEGEDITFRIFNPATSEVSGLNAIAEGGTAFMTNGISVFKSLMITGESHAEKANVSIWPNPATDHLKISIGGVETTYSVELYDSYGSNVLKMNEMSGISNIDLTNISRGVYLVKVAFQNTTYTQKVVVQ